MAEEGVIECCDLPVKRQREEEEGEDNGVLAASPVSMETDINGDKLPGFMSSVIPGWFSEISSMWPG